MIYDTGGLVSTGISEPLADSLDSVAGIVAGAAGGALVGRMFEQGVDKELMKEVREQLKPGTSALFPMVHEANARAAIAAVEPFSGQVYQSSLSTEVEDELKKALQRRE
jgi:uncharacterized membrane protein